MNVVTNKLLAPLRTLLKTSDMFVVIIPYPRPPSCESAHFSRGITSNHRCVSKLILPIVSICLLNCPTSVAKAALHTKFFKILSLNQFIKLLAR